MSEVSNRTLAALLVAAIVVSLGGTFVSLNKLGNAGGGTITLTGQAESGAGTINLTVARVLSLTMNDSNINFGAGQPNAGVATFSCDSSSAGAVNWTGDGTGCTSGTDTINVGNDGTVVGNVTMASNKNATGFICQSDLTGTCNAATVAERFSFKIPTNADCITEPVTYTPINSTAQTVCDRLGSTDEFLMNAEFVAPADYDGSALATLNFTIVDALTSACDGSC